jgi:hypothetical protein
MSSCSHWLMGLPCVSLTDCRVCQSLWADLPLKLYGQPGRLENHIFVLIPRTQRLNLNTTSTHGIQGAGVCNPFRVFIIFFLHFRTHKFSLQRAKAMPFFAKALLFVIIGNGPLCPWTMVNGPRPSSTISVDCVD